MTRLSILHKGLILIAVPLLTQLAFIFLVERIRLDNKEAQEWAVHTKEVISTAHRCQHQIVATQNALQGYFLTRDELFATLADRHKASANQSFRDLAQITSDNTPQTAAAQAMGGRASRLLDFLLDGRELIRQGRMDPTLAARRRRNAQEQLDRLDGDFESFLAQEKTLDGRRTAQAARSWALFNSLLIGGMLTSILLSVLLALLFARSISRRIGALTANARNLAEGKSLTAPITGHDEVARLDRVFREMAEVLAESARRDRDHAAQSERRARELDEVNNQLREKAQENDMFVYSVSHDLRSPLVNLQGFSKELGLLGKDLRRAVDRDDVPDAVRSEARTLIDGEMGESIRFIQTAVTRLSAIIDALLRLSRAGRVEYRWQVVDVAAIVERVVAALRGTIEERRASIEVGTLLAVWGDPTAVEQIFANLIGNALNYLDPSRPGRVAVAVERADPGCTVFAIRDNGLGIADSYQGKVFTAFQRLHGNVAQGEGVGLALVHRMVERHGGRIWFESRVGEGTTFFLELPTPAPEPAPSLPDGQERTPS